MGNSILNIGVSGLNAAQVGFQTTSHNIANASTDGYSRQTIVQTTNTPQYTGIGYLGQGTNVDAVKRVYSQYLTSQVLSAQTVASSMTAYQAQVEQVDNLLGDSDAGLSTALSNFFTGVQEATANPSSVASRQSMISSAQTLVSQFNSIDQRLSEIRDGVNSQISSEVTTINAYAAKIADLNQSIINAQAAGNGQAPNDLLDQRDQLVAELNKEVRVQTVTQADGSYSVFIGNGQPLVVGTTTSKLQAIPSPDDASRTVVATTSANGSTPIIIPESLITGGTLGGLVAFRSESLDVAQNSIGRIALSLASDFNKQHALGMDLDGKLGGSFFNLSNTVATPMANSNNLGTGAPTVSITNTALLSTSDYRLSYNGSTYTLTRLSDNTSANLGSGPTLTSTDGFSIDTSSGTPLAGDTWLVQPTRNGAKNLSLAITDPRSVALATPIRTSSGTSNTGTGTIDAGTMVSTTTPVTAASAFGTSGALTPPILVQFTSAGQYSVYDNTDPTNPVAIATGVPYTAGSAVFPIPQSYLTAAYASQATADSSGNMVLDYGYRVSISGAPSTGDQFSVDYNSSGVSDSRNGVLLGALQTAKMMESSQSSPTTGTASYATAYSQLVSLIGNTTNQVTVTAQAQQTLTDQATTAVQELSGVNLDEEAANLLKYQQAYQAAAKVISMADEIFKSILALGS